jgi:hypothetical protein
MPTSRPIAFSGSMVRAIIGGNKRRRASVEVWAPWDDAPCPFGIVGDLLWVKESLHRYDPEAPSEQVPFAVYSSDESCAFKHFASVDGTQCEYRNVMNEPKLIPWEWKRPTLTAMFMPRWASRLTLKVTGVKMERVQSISHDDGLREGVSILPGAGPNGWTVQGPSGHWNSPTVAGAYAMLWDDLHDKPGTTWADNPWVWVVSFEKANP